MNIQLKDVDNVVFNDIDVSAVKFNDVLVWRKWEALEYTGAVPVTIYAAGEPLIELIIRGNMNQSGAPTSDNPILPSETGDRTAQLWDEDYTGISGSLKYVPIFVGDGTFTLSTDTPDYSRNAPLFLLSGNVTSGASTPTNGVYNGISRTTDSSNGYITIAFRRQSESCDPTTHKTMLNSGSTALPYEPYGYKIPILMGGTTNNMYLGEVQTTRKIKKYEFTGQEDDTVLKMQSSGLFYLKITSILTLSEGYGISSHYKTEQVANVSMSDLSVKQDISSSFGSYSGVIVIKHTEYTTLADFKAYLATQYANGTPVTVWYILATPTTGIVNEPLRKIGNYADSLSVSQTIPTVEGENVVDVETTLKPSEVYIKYKGKTS